MSGNGAKENIMQPTSLQEALNIIKFLTTTHKQEVNRLKEAYKKQSDMVKKLEAARRKELEFLSNELQKYETNLSIRTETVAEQIAEKDDIIRQQAITITELNKKLMFQTFDVPKISVTADSNSDSGVAMEHEDRRTKSPEAKEVKTTRKCSRRFADPISFLRRVDFSPMKYKPSSRDGKKKDKKNSLEVPVQQKRGLTRQFSNDRPTSDEDKPETDEILSDSTMDSFVLRPKKMNDSLNNHFSDDGSDDTSEEMFDRVMARSSLRRSVKVNPKYKKINRCKSKLLEQVKINIVD